MTYDPSYMKIKLFTFAFFYIFLITNSLTGTEIGDLVIVTKDSVPLRTESNNQAKIAKYVNVSLQLKILDISDDKKWYEVKIGEQKGYQMSHIEKYWVFHEDVYQEPENPNFEIQLDVSVLKNDKLYNAKRISYKDYLWKLKSLHWILLIMWVLPILINLPICLVHRLSVFVLKYINRVTTFLI